MKRSHLACLFCLASALMYLACEGKIDPPGDGDGDIDADADADADEEEEECSMNSGAFCTCDHPFDGQCDDGTFCISVLNLGEPGDLGYCAPSCNCDNYDENCQETPYNATARCILARPWPITDETNCNCVLMNCDANTDCPPEQQCHEIVGGQGPYEGVTLWICSP